MHHDHGATGGLQATKHFDESLFGSGIDSREGLVHQIEIGVLSQRPGDEDPLLLAYRELADLAMGQMDHPHLGEGLQRSLPIPSPWTSNPAQVTITPHQHHIQNRGREIPVHCGPLGNVGDPPSGLRWRTSENGDRARDRSDQAQDRPEQSGLPRPVGAHHCHQHPGGDLPVHIPEHRTIPVHHGEICDLNHRALDGR